MPLIKLKAQHYHCRISEGQNLKGFLILTSFFSLIKVDYVKAGITFPGELCDCACVDKPCKPIASKDIIFKFSSNGFQQNFLKAPRVEKIWGKKEKISNAVSDMNALYFLIFQDCQYI